MDWVAAVWRYIPTSLRMPASVTEDGKGGVTTATFEGFVALTKKRVEDKLVAAIVPLPDWELDALDLVLESAIAQIIAGYILRKFPAYETLYSDYFANGFAALDDYIVNNRGDDGYSNVPEFVDEPTDDISGYAFPQNW